MKSTTKINSYLGIADVDYLSGRILLFCGMHTTALSKFCEAFEKIMKLFLIIEAKITSNQELSSKTLKSYNHNIVNLFHEIKLKTPTNFPPEWDSLIRDIQNAYGRRYPEHWNKFMVQFTLQDIDHIYVYFRNLVVNNFPLELKENAKDFGTFLLRSYSIDVINEIRSYGLKTPEEFLKFKNDSFENLIINPIGA